MPQIRNTTTEDYGADDEVKEYKQDEDENEANETNVDLVNDIKSDLIKKDAERIEVCVCFWTRVLHGHATPRKVGNLGVNQSSILAAIYCSPEPLDSGRLNSKRSPLGSEVCLGKITTSKGILDPGKCARWFQTALPIPWRCSEKINASDCVQAVKTCVGSCAFDGV